MANTVEITFNVTPSAGIVACLISCDGKPIRTRNGSGNAVLTTGASHTLTWHTWGEGGAYVGISGKKPSDKEVVKIAKTRIPDGEDQGFGGIRFDL